MIYPSPCPSGNTYVIPHQHTIHKLQDSHHNQEPHEHINQLRPLGRLIQIILPYWQCDRLRTLVAWLADLGCWNGARSCGGDLGRRCGGGSDVAGVAFGCHCGEDEVIGERKEAGKIRPVVEKKCIRNSRELVSKATKLDVWGKSPGASFSQQPAQDLANRCKHPTSTRLRGNSTLINIPCKTRGIKLFASLWLTLRLVLCSTANKQIMCNFLDLFQQGRRCNIKTRAPALYIALSIVQLLYDLFRDNAQAWSKR